MTKNRKKNRWIRKSIKWRNKHFLSLEWKCGKISRKTVSKRVKFSWSCMTWVCVVSKGIREGFFEAGNVIWVEKWKSMKLKDNFQYSHNIYYSWRVMERKNDVAIKPKLKSINSPLSTTFRWPFVLALPPFFKSVFISAASSFIEKWNLFFTFSPETSVCQAVLLFLNSVRGSTKKPASKGIYNSNESDVFCFWIQIDSDYQLKTRWK